eukprot:m.57479 g.57479  ORF g.57479 m.57479 type:complete len:914 (+) comp11111_c0_seq1:86-2827(+)
MRADFFIMNVLSFCCTLLVSSTVSASRDPVICPAGVSNKSFELNLTNIELLDGILALSNTTNEKCFALCCSQKNCTAWNYHVSSTDKTHHPKECWLSTSTTPQFKPGMSSDVWTGGGPKTDDTRGGASIQPLSSWFYYGSTQKDTLLRELTDQSIALLKQREENISAIGNSTNAWKARVAAAQTALKTVFHPLPEQNRSVPVFKVVQTLLRPSYKCEKILYESRPGFWVTAVLWTPLDLVNSRDGKPKKAPGVLLTSGHTPDGFRSNNLGADPPHNSPGDDDYEVVQINLVLRGFVVLAFDPIGQGERLQYADVPLGKPDPEYPWSKGAKGATLYGSTTEHEYMGRQLLLNGIGLMSFWLHDETVSLDVLSSLSYVDSDNLGVVGCSGGGTQSSYLAAMDPRIKAVSMACYMSTFEIDRLWAAGGASDGEQTWPHGIKLGLDKSDLIEVRGDRSTQVLVTTADTCFPASGGWAAVQEAGAAYASLGGNLTVFTGVWHHGWVQPTREQLYRYICDSLKDGFSSPSLLCQNSAEKDVSRDNPQYTEWSDDDLKVTSTGQVVTSKECGASNSTPAITVHNFTADITNSNLMSLKLKRESNKQGFLADIRNMAPTISGFQDLPTPKAPRFLGAQFMKPHVPGPPHPNDPPIDTEGSSVGLVEQWMVFGEGVCFSTVTLYFPASVSDMMTPRPAMKTVVMYTASAAQPSNPSVEVLQFVGNGYLVAVVELCGFGQTSGAFSSGISGRGQAAEDMAHEIGRSIPGIHAGDIVRVSSFLLKKPYVSSIDMSISFDAIDVAVLHALLARPDLAPPKIALVAPRATLSAAAKARFYDTSDYYSWVFGVLQYYDLPDLVAATVENLSSVMILGPVDELKHAITVGEANQTYEFAASMASKDLKVYCGNFSDEEVAQKVMEWSM